jgi:riboflavin transporter FmnP
MLAAISYVVMLFGRIPMVLFLKYDPKDVIITIGGFIYGPMVAAIISVCVSFVEMFTASDTGFYGLIMNIISTCAFACTASLIYKKKRTITGALAGLILATIFMSSIMLLWNYYITPLYLNQPREAVIPLLLPTILPFNLIKGALNASFTIMIYKPIVNGLRKAKLLPSVDTSGKKLISIGTLLCSVFVAICLIMLVKIIWP